jgi:hypothetical protein
MQASSDIFLGFASARGVDYAAASAAARTGWLVVPEPRPAVTTA